MKYPIGVRCTNPFIVPLLAASLMLCTAGANAVSIDLISLVNNSAPEEAAAFTNFLDAPQGTAEFHTASNLGAVHTNGSDLTFTSQFQWYNSLNVTNGYLAESHSRTIAYNMSFTVTDDENAGYSLSIDSLMRGCTTAAWG
jgi:hypothetical protein